MKVDLSPAAAVAAAVALLAAGGFAAATVAASHDEPGPKAGTWTPATGQTPDPVKPTQTPVPAKPTQTPVPVNPTQTPVPTAGTQVAVPDLKPDQVKYDHRVWGDPKTESGVVVWAPKDWPMVKLSTFEAQFTSPNKLWSLRINGVITDELPLNTAVDQKVAILQGTPGIRILSRVNGTTQATNQIFAGTTFHHTTLTYSYADPARGTRLVVDRFVVFGGSPAAGIEISTGGRPQDRAGLDAITAKATEDYIRLP